MTFPADAEATRIKEEYRRRAREIPSDYYSLVRPENLFRRHSQESALLSLLRRANELPLANKSALEVGCGAGLWLQMLEDFDVPQESLSGIELDEGRAASCRRRLPAADIREGDARDLPWPDESFDIVLQSTMFTSILDSAARQTTAAEMLRVLKPDGFVVWYDFSYDNPRNANVRGIRRKEILDLFPDCEFLLRRVTLAPPIARYAVPVSWIGTMLLERLRLMNTHIMGIIRKKS